MKIGRKTGICLVAGALLLTVSATAAFGSVNGYSRYKDAVENLLLTEDNFTAQIQLRLAVDGQDMGTVQVDYAKDGGNTAYHSLDLVGGTSHQEHRTILDGTKTWFSDSQTFYETATVPQEDILEKLVGDELDKEMKDRIIDFAETAADLVVGELKNNVVQLAAQEEETLYQVQVARSQIPSLLNAGLSVLSCYSTGEPVQRYLCYEDDYSAVLLSRYEAATGVTLSQEDRDIWLQGNYDGAWEKRHAQLLAGLDAFACSNWDQEYEDLKAQKDQGVLYVKRDGSYVDYDTVSAFLADYPQRRHEYLDFYLGGDVAMQDAVCTFSIDGAGHLTGNQFQVNLNTIDSAGGHHKMQADISLTFANYGTTTVSPLDVGDRVKLT